MSKGPGINFWIDNSMSMKNHTEGGEKLKSKISNILNSLNYRNLSVEMSSFSDHVSKLDDIEEIEFDGKATDFTPLIEKINYKQNDLHILFSDGIETKGIELNSFAEKVKNPVYTIGLGGVKVYDELAVESIEFPKYLVKGDTLTGVVTFACYVDKKIKPVILVSNSKGNIYRQQIEINQGFSKLDVNLEFPWHELDKLNEIQIISDIDEQNTENNSKSFKLELLDSAREISIITGMVSENTPFLKKLLKTIPRTKIIHSFRIGNTWNNKWKNIITENTQLVILDDYPARTGELNDFAEMTTFLKDGNIPFIYFSGISSNEKVMSNISESFDMRFDPNPSSLSFLNNPVPVGWNDGLPSDLPPALKSGTWIPIEIKDVLLSYKDHSAAILEKGLNGAVFIEELNKLYLQCQYLNQTPDLFNYLKYFISTKIKLNKPTLAVDLENPNLYFGESVQIKYQLNPGYVEKSIEKLITVKHESSESHFINIPESNKINSTVLYFPENYGNYEIRGLIVENTGDTIWSNSVDLTIHKLHVENRQVIQNIQGLKSLADLSGGIYMPFLKIDSLINALPINTRIVKESKQAGVNDVQKFWTILIILLVLEWIIRKKTGLL